MPYRVRIIAAPLGAGTDSKSRLLFGEAVERPNAAISAPRVDTLTGISGLSHVRIAEALIEDIQPLIMDLADNHAVFEGLEFGTSVLRERPSVILGPLHTMDPDAGSTLHPDERFTYRVSEWWDADEQTFSLLWNTREFLEISTRIHAATGINFSHLSDRIGNFIVWRRVSSWWMDSKYDASQETHWVRPLHDGPTESREFTLHARFLSGDAVAMETTCGMDSAGAQLKVPADVSTTALSLFDATSGEILSKQTSTVLGDVKTREGAVEEGSAVDAGRKRHDISWTRWGGSAPHINPRAPWADRLRLRRSRNELIREASRVFYFHKGDRPKVLERLREIVRSAESELMFWDPYFDATATKDLLSWAPPWCPIRILCGSPKDQQPFKAALDELRSGPRARTIDCIHRVFPPRKRSDGSVQPKSRAVYHDRFLIMKSSARMLGSSFTSIGNKAGALVRVLDPDRVLWMFEDEWRNRPDNSIETKL